MRSAANWQSEDLAAVSMDAGPGEMRGARFGGSAGSRNGALALQAVAAADGEGVALARSLREETRAAAMMLARLAGLLERLSAAGLGADDEEEDRHYVAGPLDLDHVLQRIGAAPRRAPAAPARPAAAPAAAGEIRFGRFTLKLHEHQLCGPDGSAVPLTSMEFDLLKALGQHPNKTLSRDQLLDLAHGRGWEPFDRSIDVRIARLRRKIEHDPARPRIIRTVRGAGYRFVPTAG